MPWRRKETRWPGPDDPVCWRCGHYEISHDQDGSACYYRVDTATQAAQTVRGKGGLERLCECKGYKLAGPRK